MKWFRLYDTVLDDPKVQRLKPELFKAWINLLCIACKKGGAIPTNPADLAFMLRCDADTAERWFAELTDAGLIDITDSAARPHDWDKFQYVSDCSTARVRDHRAKKSANKRPDPSGGGKMERARNVSVTPPESESEQNQKEGRTNRPSTRARRAPTPTPAIGLQIFKDLADHCAGDIAKLGRVARSLAESPNPEATAQKILADEGPRPENVVPYVSRNRFVRIGQQLLREFDEREETRNAIGKLLTPPRP